MSIAYSKGITITEKYIDGNARIAITPADKALDFVQTTKTFLDKLKSLPTGAKLLQAIDQSGHTVKIYRVKDIDDGNSQGGSTNDEMVLNLDAKIGKETVLERILQKATEDMSQRSSVQKFLGIGKAKPKFLNRDAIAKLVGTSRSELDKMAAGKLAIPQKVADRIKSYLYHFLEAGPGCDCYVQFNHKRINLSDAHRRLLPMNKNWEHRPPAIALGHELIHAWRAVSGLVLYEYGWEEEAMTVGLPPFAYMDFTENRLRIEYGELAIRPDYQGIANETKLTKNQKLGLDSNQAWQGQESALYAKTSGGWQQAQPSATFGQNPTGF